jgi:hypothetical protein
MQERASDGKTEKVLDLALRITEIANAAKAIGQADYAQSLEESRASLLKDAGLTDADLARHVAKLADAAAADRAG